MSLSLTQKNDLKLIHQHHQGVVVLEAGANPSNTRQAIAGITMWTNAHTLDHLLSYKFNVTATVANEHNKLELLEAREKQVAVAAAAAAAAAGTGKQSVSPPSPSSSSSYASPPQGVWGDEQKTQVKHEYAPLTGGTGSDTIVTYSATGAKTTTIAASSHYFTDPCRWESPGLAEDPSQRQDRMRLWAFCSATCYYHQHLLSGLRIGDISGILQAISAYGLSHGSQDTLDGITAMTTLTKKGHSWQELVTAISTVRAVLDRETDPDWQIGRKVLPGFVLRAMESDPRFDFELTLLRRTQPAPDLDHIMATLGAKARTMSKPSHLSGHIADPTPAPAPATGTTVELCRAFQNGKCRFDRPEHGRWCRHSHGAALDKQRAIDKKAYKAKPRTGGKPADAAKPAASAGKKPFNVAVDGCYRCGSKNHGIDDCTEDKVRGLAAAVPPAGLTTDGPSLGVTQMADAIALALQQRAANSLPSAADQAGVSGLSADPLGVGPTNTLLDFHLAKIFNASGANT
jgi:hypothetical protein